MRAALIFMCGLGILAAASATIEESRLGIRESRFVARDAGAVATSSLQPDSDLEAQTTSRAAADEPIAVSCPTAASNPERGTGSVQLAGATH